MQYYIEIVEYPTKELADDEEFQIERRLGPYSSERLADRADNGINRQLDHERFFTRIVETQS